jgi:hypothetical protein
MTSGWCPDATVVIVTQLPATQATIATWLSPIAKLGQCIMVSTSSANGCQLSAVTTTRLPNASVHETVRQPLIVASKSSTAFILKPPGSACGSVGGATALDSTGSESPCHRMVCGLYGSAWAQITPLSPEPMVMPARVGNWTLAASRRPLHRARRQRQRQARSRRSTKATVSASGRQACECHHAPVRVPSAAAEIGTR